MSHKATVLRDFKLYSPTGMVTFGDQVYFQMNSHPLVFVTPKIPLLTMKGVNDELRARNLAAATGDKASIDARDNYVPVWIDTFDQQGDYVQALANGNKAIIEEGGYHSSKTDFGHVEIPNKLLMDCTPNPGHGSIHYKAKAAGHPDGYFTLAVKQPAGTPPLEVSVDDNGVKLTWGGLEVYVKVSTRHQGDYNGLAPRGAELNVMMAAFNAAGMGPLSEPVSVIIP
jgi:hypothetical protein